MTSGHRIEKTQRLYVIFRSYITNLDKKLNYHYVTEVRILSVSVTLNVIKLLLHKAKRKNSSGLTYEI